MPYTLSTSTLTQILEGSDFSESVSVLKTNLDPVITSITVSPVEPINGNINIGVNVVGESFTISGQYLNNFDKKITYLDDRLDTQVVSSKKAFDAVPDSYFTITEYIASRDTVFTAAYSVTVNGSNIGAITQQVNNNYTPGRDALIAAVQKGKI